MKYCPTCEMRFDDEVMRFCTKDGTPLIEEKEPNFIEMPSSPIEEPAPVVASADEDEAGEVTIVRRNIPVPPPPSFDDNDFSEAPARPAERIVVPMTPEPAVDPVRNRNAVYYPPPKRTNTLLVVVLSVFGTVAVLGIGAGLLWIVQRGRVSNTNINANLNSNTNQNTNTGFDSNFNFNVNPTVGSTSGSNSSVNSNANLKTPTPTPSPSATPTPRPSPSTTPTPDVLIEPTVPRPTPTPFDGRPRTTPTPASSPSMRATPRPTPRVTITP